MLKRIKILILKKQIDGNARNLKNKYFTFLMIWVPGKCFCKSRKQQKLSKNCSTTELERCELLLMHSSVLRSNTIFCI